MKKAKIVKRATYPGYVRLIVEALGRNGGQFYMPAFMRVVTVKAGTEYYRVDGNNVLAVEAVFEFNAVSDIQRTMAIELATAKMVELENAEFSTSAV